MILGLLISEYFMIFGANVKFNNQNFAIDNSIKVMQYYNTSCQLDLSLLYLDFHDNYNYSNSFFQLDMQNTALKLQATNE